jgi:hypothetical protein
MARVCRKVGFGGNGRWFAVSIAALHLFRKVRQSLDLNRINVRFPPVTGAGAKIFSRLKKGHGFWPFSSASDQSRNLAETGFCFAQN